jgi:signal transduction histidine kinase
MWLRLAMIFMVMGAVAAAVPARATRPSPDFIAEMTVPLATDPVAAVDRAAQEIAALRRSGLARRDARLAAAYWVRAQAHFRLGDTVLARQSLLLAESALTTDVGGRRVRGYARLLRGLLLRDAGKTGEALQKLREAQTDFIAVRDNRGHALALQSVGILYNDAGDGRSAIRYLTLAGESYDGDDVFDLSRNINIGVAYLLVDEDREAIRHFELAKTAADRLQINGFREQILLNIATADLSIDDLSAAKRVLASLGPIAGLPDGERRWALQLKASIALREGRVAEARRFIENALAGLSVEDGQTANWPLHFVAYEIFQAQGDVPAALRQLEIVRRIETAEAAQIASTRSALLAAQFRSDAQDTRIAQLKAATLQREVEFQRTLTILLVIGGLVLVMLLGGLLFIAIRSRNRARANGVALAAINVELERALAAKTEFLASTSHELRTPLNGILGMAQIMLADGGLPGRLRTQIELVHDAGTTMRALVDDILDVAKIEHGGFTVTPTPNDVASLVKRVTGLFADQAASRGLMVTCSGTLPAPVALVDGNRLTQIIFNLVGNAMKFTHRGSIEVTLAVESVDGSDRLILRVADTGIGIAPEWQGVIFEMFRQVDNKRTRSYSGTGLGLAICRQLARAMGGDIALTSEEGVGSCFEVHIPWQPVSGEDDRHPVGRGMLSPSVSPAAGADAQLSAIAIVAANPMRAAMLAAIVRRIGHEPHILDTDRQILTAVGCKTLTLLVDRAAWPRVSTCVGGTTMPAARLIVIGDPAGETVMAGEGGPRQNNVAFALNAIAAALAVVPQASDKKDKTGLHGAQRTANGNGEAGAEHKYVVPMSRM